MNTKHYDIENKSPVLGQAHTYGWVKPVNGIIVHLREYKLFLLELSPFDLVSWSYCLCKMGKVRFMVFNITLNKYFSYIVVVLYSLIISNCNMETPRKPLSKYWCLIPHCNIVLNCFDPAKGTHQVAKATTTFFFL